jgi:ElaB/YqjD/DUF883 family membrane-anchored ribosome-binding protein
MAFRGGDRSSATNDIARDLRLLQDDVAKLAEQISGQLNEGGNAVLTQARQRIEQLRQSLSEVALGNSGDGGLIATDIAASVEEALHRHPLTAVTTAFTIGFVLGTGWYRRA